MNETKSTSFAQLYPILAEEIEKGNSFVFTAMGKSMLPFLRGGKDRVTLSPLTRPLRKNDIIFYRRKNGAFVLHRIIACTHKGYTLCGDNQYYEEKGIQKEDVIGILTGLERKGRQKNLSGVSHKIWCFFLPARRFFLRSIAYLVRKIKQ